MRRIKSKDTTPELVVRSVTHSLGYRFRLHRADLPGKPDLVFPGRKAVIFVHGCFWHQHPSVACSDSRLPKTRVEYWLPKLARNQARDKQNIAALRKLGWRIMVVWDCETAKRETLTRRLKEFLGATAKG
ncbi:DNA mismatch endonuclease Vsr [Ramlibacter sp. WS9]|nr:DNA mismatch endonuclease Vsr [Ramlibacter sp. WS9]